jgi:hypothetical protein
MIGVMGMWTQVYMASLYSQLIVRTISGLLVGYLPVAFRTFAWKAIDIFLNVLICKIVI